MFIFFAEFEAKAGDKQLYPVARPGIAGGGHDGNSNLPSPDAVVDFVPMSANVNVQSHTVANTAFRCHK